MKYKAPFILVYLHDAPKTELFSRSRRDFSYGCIRVQDPPALAAWVLRSKPEWTPERIRAAMNGEKSVQVNLSSPIPVLILYGTARVDEDGFVYFYDDIYGHDAKLARAAYRPRSRAACSSLRRCARTCRNETENHARHERAAKFRSGSAKDDFAGDLLDDAYASKFIDCVPPDLGGLVAYGDAIDLGEEARALVPEWRRLRKAA
jgi:hypothetical protein